MNAIVEIAPSRTVDPSVYCREIESYLTRKNEGHLVRIVGPAFEQVCGWAAMGVPLKVAFRGIDQYCERYHAKGPRRRPVRIEFCEGDILDLFDAWRRAVGVAAAASAQEAGQEPSAGPPPRKPPLAAHIERAIARLANVRVHQARAAALGGIVDACVRDLERLAGEARNARGDHRARILEALAAIDRGLIEAAVGAVDAATAASLRREAEIELAPFGGRLAPEARSQALAAAFERLVREWFSLPTVRMQP